MHTASWLSHVSLSLSDARSGRAHKYRWTIGLEEPPSARVSRRRSAETGLHIQAELLMNSAARFHTGALCEQASHSLAHASGCASAAHPCPAGHAQLFCATDMHC